MTNNIIKHGILILALQLLLACSGFDGEFQQAIQDGSVSRKIVRGDIFSHTVFINKKALEYSVFERSEASTVSTSGLFESSSHRLLKVYIGGDGSPWINGRQVALDPTPRNPLGLKLFFQDPTASIFIARPCYFTQGASRGCNDSSWWTDARYSEPVITSMVWALGRIQQQLGANKIMLIGYSGGGALAALLAERMPQVVALVSVGANLDIDFWTRHHGYLALKRSQNPTLMQPLRDSLWAVHLVGARDTVVPANTALLFTKKHKGLVWTYQEYDHACCWEREWLTILKRISGAYSQQSMVNLR